MPKVAVTHPVVRIERWLKGKAEQRSANASLPAHRTNGMSRRR